MEKLIELKDYNGVSAVSARELYEALGFDISNWAKWYEKNILNNEFAFKKEDYIELVASTRTKDFALTLDFAKRICMMARTEAGEKIRNYFIECEKISKNYLIPQTLPEALRLAADLAEKNQALLSENIEMKPKAEFYDAVVDSKDAIDMGLVAKTLNLGYGRNTLFEKLRDLKVLMSNNIPYQNFIDKAWFRTIESKYTKPNGDTCINIKTVVLQKGMNEILKVLSKGAN